MPSSGKIFIGDKDTSTMAREAMVKKVSVVFQDVYLLPTTVERNITLDVRTEREKYNRAINLSGIDKKINSLDDKGNTLLVREVNEEAKALSGGEIQKLALSRALYKGGDIVVLDEPTAALDPIAENELYLKYNELIDGKTAVFISHRLSSTQFCDRILFLENGKIAESGTHDELMKLGGGYAHMYQVQSQNYRPDNS